MSDDEGFEWHVAIDLFDDDDATRRRHLRPKKTTRWVPSFHELVDLQMRTFTLTLNNGSVTVNLAYRENGTGSSVWDAAIVLAKFLELSGQARDCAVLELGAGTGLCGLVASALGARSVVLTDLHECLPLLRDNAQPFPNVCVEALPWGRTVALPLCDLVLLADCLLPGGTHLFEPLARTIHSFLLRNASVLFAYEERTDCSAFFDNLDKLGVTFRQIPPAKLHPLYQAQDIHLLSLSLL